MVAAVLVALIGLGPPTTARSARPRAWIVVDAGTGAVLDAHDDRTPMPPASLTKLLTSLIAVGHLKPPDTLSVSDRAAGEPASKINMKAGQVWTFQDALYALLLSSANDAAAAIAERVAGSLDAFAEELRQAGTVLGLADNPTLNDPAGLDDNFSVGGGNLLSARDLAIVGRAALAQPLLAQVVSTKVYEFVGPDGSHHRLGNHNRLLTTYPGAIGLKTGFTKKAGENLLSAATRGNRTLVAVVLGAPNLYQDTADLLNAGFASTAGTGDVLPEVRPVTVGPAGADPAPALVTIPAPATSHGGDNRALLAAAVGALTAGVLVSARRRQIRIRRQRRIRRLHGRSGRTPTTPEWR